MQKDWRYQTATIKGLVWVNMVGTYGIASAQYHWGRMAALILRILYATFPDIHWAFVFVDDFALLVPKHLAQTLCFVITCFLEALGLPISWKKTAVGSPNSWLGYLISCETITATLMPDKQLVITQTLQRLASSRHLAVDEVHKMAGRLNWATMIYPLMRPFLHPIFAWLTALLRRQENQKWGTVKARPTDTVKVVANTLSNIFAYVPPSLRPAHTHSRILAATDAGARTVAGLHEAVVGGWYTTSASNKWGAHWFFTKIDPVTHPWAYDKGDPQKKIAVLELYGSLLLYRHIIVTHPALSINMQLTLATDNRGNAYQVTNHKAKNSTAAAMLMELSLIQHHSHSPVQLTHTYRENNAWADSLTHCNSEGFNPSMQFKPDQANWHILHKLIPGLPGQTTTGGVTP